MIMNTTNQVLGGYCLMILWNGNRPRNFKGLLDQRWCHGDHPLHRDFATIKLIVLLSVAGRCWEICIEIGIAEAPVCCQVKPFVSRRERNRLTGNAIGPIEQVSVCNTCGSEPPA